MLHSLRALPWLVTSLPAIDKSTHQLAALPSLVTSLSCHRYIHPPTCMKANQQQNWSRAKAEQAMFLKMNINGRSKVQSHDNSTEGAKVLQQSSWNPPCVLILHKTHVWLHARSRSICPVHTQHQSCPVHTQHQSKTLKLTPCKN